MMPVKALEAARYGRLVPIDHQSGGWLCRCDCGAECVVTGSHLREGQVQSCGCLNREKRAEAKKHGMRYSRTWVIWNLMRQRCTNPKNDSFKNYGARGIAVCERWSDFSAFLADMGEAPAGRTIERIRNNEGCAPENCRWVTRAEQALNTRRNRLITLAGRTQPLSLWCQELQIPYWTAHARLRRGASPEKALAK